MTFVHTIKKDGSDDAARGTVTVAFVGAQGRPVRVPAEIKRVLQMVLQTTGERDGLPRRNTRPAFQDRLPDAPDGQSTTDPMYGIFFNAEMVKKAVTAVRAAVKGMPAAG